MIETAVRCDVCGHVIEDDFDECCGKTYTELYKCKCCGDWVEELEDGECKWCIDQRTPEMTWSQFYGRKRA